MATREQIEEQLEEGTIILEGFDEAYIGATHEGAAVYDFEKMVEVLMKRDGMTDEEAMDWLNYNTIRSLDYIPDPTPVILYPLEE